MKITDSAISLNSENQKTFIHTKKESLMVSGSTTLPGNISKGQLKNELLKDPDNYLGAVYDKDGNMIAGKKSNESIEDALKNAEKTQEDLEKQHENNLKKVIENRESTSGERIPTMEEVKEQIKRSIIRMLHAMLGGNPDDIDDGFAELNEKIRNLKSESMTSGRSRVPEWNKTFSVSYEREEMIYSSETTRFSATGVVKTSDGREIALNMNFHSEKELAFISRESFTGEVTIRQEPPAIDPLVINIDQPSAGISDITIDFDLDVDGVMDKVSFVDRGSGFLALDKNGDGKINDGSELFGTRSGDGFKDLAKYDLDNNGWIDENDAVFDKLKIWILGTDNKPTLISLKKAGIGAIHLGNVQTNMTLTDSTYDTRGYLRKSGIYLKENGEVSTIQHVDLVG